MTRYTRQDVLRMLKIHATQLRAWERAALIPSPESYSFEDLLQIRKLRDLRATRLSVASIREGVRAMRNVSGMVNPLLEAGTVQDGARLAFRIGGAAMEPIARQFVFDFAAAQSGLQVLDSAASRSHREARVNELFLQAVQLEEKGKVSEAAELYAQILEIDANHAPACINLGTIQYNLRMFDQAEQFYRRATVCDPGYALAFFDLGNVLDELHRMPEAIEAYQRAIRLVPTYADAHYNLALAFERSGERRKALRHWTAYLKLDPVGPWASHARCQARKTIDREKLTIIHRSPRVGAERRVTRRTAAREFPAPSAV